MKRMMEKLEQLLEMGGTKKDVALLAASGVALAASLLGFRPLGVDAA